MAGRVGLVFCSAMGLLLSVPILAASVSSSHAFIQVRINTETATASISGGESGPGKVDADTGSVTYCWTLPVKVFTEKSDHSAEELMRALSSSMHIIGEVAFKSSQSIPLDGSADYDGEQICFAGTGLGAPSDGGQFQVLGVDIDLSHVKDPNYANLSWLPKGLYGAKPIKHRTKGNVTIIID
ncbi:hypothetical protein E1162_17800 [Rhodobacteraceae bacterium RKSG542]|uniref:hypothetical protein n=1 Tax=Pseudovibrio flavus TaxID=2529854 RepID=UPI0012BB8920|nr:hypothetical protein [Pseudovibrio flavus]MTI19100.1 hypothetical protein [Pseudovibrio flavus]